MVVKSAMSIGGMGLTQMENRFHPLREVANKGSASKLLKRLLIIGKWTRVAEGNSGEG